MQQVTRSRRGRGSFRRRARFSAAIGYHAAGVDQVMEEAGLTAGGFYAHFESKEALLAEMLAPAAAAAEIDLDRSHEARKAPRGFGHSSIVI